MPQVEEFKLLRVLFTSEREGNGTSIEELVLRLQCCSDADAVPVCRGEKRV